MLKSIRCKLWTLKLMIFAVSFEIGDSNLGFGWIARGRREPARRSPELPAPSSGRVQAWLSAEETEARQRGERGDVPGWVLVTLMTAGLVIAIWAVAGPALVNVFNTAITRITSI